MSVELTKIFTAVDAALKRNLEGITHEDSIKHIENANSINWILGHIVVSRNGILSAMGLPAVASDKHKAIYERGSKMMTDMSLAEKLETLLELFDEEQKKILEGVAKVSDNAVKERVAF